GGIVVDVHRCQHGVTVRRLVPTLFGIAGVLERVEDSTDAVDMPEGFLRRLDPRDVLADLLLMPALVTSHIDGVTVGQGRNSEGNEARDRRTEQRPGQTHHRNLPDIHAGIVRGSTPVARYRVRPDASVRPIGAVWAP